MVFHLPWFTSFPRFTHGDTGVGSITTSSLGVAVTQPWCCTSETSIEQWWKAGEQWWVPETNQTTGVLKARVDIKSCFSIELGGFLF